MSEEIMRPAAGVLTQFSKPANEYTLREAIEWWKGCVRSATQMLGKPTAREADHLNEQWTVLITAIAEREGVGAGVLAYLLNEVAALEMQVAETAAAELKEATS